MLTSQLPEKHYRCVVVSYSFIENANGDFRTNRNRGKFGKEVNKNFSRSELGLVLDLESGDCESANKHRLSLSVILPIFASDELTVRRIY